MAAQVKTTNRVSLCPPSSTASTVSEITQEQHDRAKRNRQKVLRIQKQLKEKEERNRQATLQKQRELAQHAEAD